MHPSEHSGFDAASLAPFVEMATQSIHREYPYHLTVVMTGETPLRRPQDLTPAFHGSFDWHSAVHCHWALARAARLLPQAPWAMRAKLALAVTLTESRLQGELAFLSAPGREGFERPYGLAWLLQLASELRAWDDVSARSWYGWLQPLEQVAASRLAGWLERLPWPIRAGEHSQSAFALGLFLDWARAAGNEELHARASERIIRLYTADRDAPVRYEPSGHDFLSPILGEADLLRRALPAASYRPWLQRFLPAHDAPELTAWLRPVTSPNPEDGKLSHLDGLNLSRAWMLEGIVSALPADDALQAPLAAAAEAHCRAGLAGAATPHYAGTHWLGSFAIYLLTRRGIGA